MIEPYSEKLVIENILDHGNNQMVHLKADIKTKRTFYLDVLDLDFGECYVGDRTLKLEVPMTNISKKKREFSLVKGDHG